MKIILMDTDNASDKRSYYDTNSKKKVYKECVCILSHSVVSSSLQPYGL